MEELKKNQTHIAEICGYSSTGAGVCRIGGRAVFVDKALVGETWEILILKVSSAAVFGKGIKLLKASDQRRQPPCPSFGKCGGCDLMHMSYEEELHFKLCRVNDALRRIGGLDFSVEKIIGSSDNSIYNYRNKAIYAVGSADNGSAVTGFFRERSHSIVPVDSCLIQTELSSDCATALRSFMDKNAVPAYDEADGSGLIRHLFTRCSLKYPQSVACVVSTKRLGALETELVQALRTACPQLTGIVLCVNKSEENTVLSGSFHTLWGSEYIEDELCGLKFRISPMSFYQINPRQAEGLYQLAVNYAIPTAGVKFLNEFFSGKGITLDSDLDDPCISIAEYHGGSGTVLDLYCGTGTISLCLAKKAKMVIGAEIVEAAVENARRNAEENGIENVRFICADASLAAAQLAAEGIRPDAVVVDPPRKGLAPDVVDIICEMQPLRVVYVSCDPATLARDVKHFYEKGYLPRKGMAVDMFPRCAHVETVLLLVREG